MKFLFSFKNYSFYYIKNSTKMNNQQFINNYAIIEVPPPSYSEIYSNNLFSKPNLVQLKTCFRQNFIHFIIAFSLLFLAPMIIFLILIKFFITL